jgi:formamidase
MNGLGGLNKSQNGVVVGVVQQQLPVTKTAEDLATQAKVLNDMVGRARRNLPTLDLVVFPEYALHGLSMSGGTGLPASVP